MLHRRGLVLGMEYSSRHECDVTIMVRAPQYEGQSLYYLLDTRQVVGNCALWWRPNGKGYTCQLTEAGLYTEEQAFSHRDTDVPVEREIAERLAISHVRTEALAEAGVPIRRGL